MTSNFDPDLFRPTASEAIAKMAKDSLDDMGGNYDHLKDVLDKAIQPEKGPHMSLGEAVEKDLY